MTPRALVVLATLLTLAALALAFARYDLEISRQLVDRTAVWAHLLERYGALPGVYAIAICATLLHFDERARSMARRLFALLASAITLGVAVAVSAYRLFDHRLSVGTALVVVGAFALSLGGSRWRGLGLSLPPRINRACAAVLALGAWSWVLVYGLKAAWGRVRFRDLDATWSAFTPWYAPQGFTGHASFPSGHAVMGWVLLPLIALWPVGSRGSVTAGVVIIAWGAFVSASRVVAGAHYASDVLFSTALAIVLALRFAARARPVSEAPRV